MWEGSTKLGIGQATGKNNGMFCTYIVGRYKPAGNFQGKYDANVKKGSFEKDKICDNLDDMIKNMDSNGDNGDSTSSSENKGGGNESVGGGGGGGGGDNNQNGENGAGSSSQSSGGAGEGGGSSSEDGGGGLGGVQTGGSNQGDSQGGSNLNSGGGGESNTPSDAGTGASTDNGGAGGGGSEGGGATNIEQPELVIAREEALKAATEIGVKIGKEIAAKYKASQKDEILPSAKQALDLTMSSFNQRRLNMSTAAFLDSIRKQVRLQKKSPIVQYRYEKLKKSKILPHHKRRRKSKVLPIREKRSSMLNDENARRKISPTLDIAKNINAKTSKCSLTKRHHISKKPNTRLSLIEYEKYMNKNPGGFRNETAVGTKKSTMTDIVALGAKLNAILASKSGTKKSNMQDIVKLGAKIGAIEGAKAGAIAGMCSVHSCLFQLRFLNSFWFFSYSFYQKVHSVHIFYFDSR